MKLISRLLKLYEKYTGLLNGTNGQFETVDYQQLFENSTAGIGRTRISSGSIVFANRRLAEIFGYVDVDEFIKNYLFEEHYLDEAGSQRQIKFYENIPDSLVEACFMDRLGKAVHVQAEVKMDKALDHIDFVMIDVSDKRETELKLAQSQNDNPELFENDTVGIGRNRLSDGKILQANLKIAEIFGFDSIQTFIDEYNFIEGWVNPDDRENLLKSLNSHRMQFSEQQFQLLDGSIITLMACDVVSEDDDWVDYLAVDISESTNKNAEKWHYQNIVDALMQKSAVPITITDLQGDVLLVSSAFAKYAEKSVDEIQGHSSSDFFTDESQQLLQNADERIKATGLPLGLDESFPIEFGDSVLQVSKFPVLSELDEVTAIATIGVDITRSVNSELELRRQKLELEESRISLEQTIDTRTKKLRESEELFRHFFETIPDAYLITDLENDNCINVNEGFCRMSGFSAHEAIGASTLALDLWKNDIDRERLVSAINSNGYIANLNAEFRRKDGSFWAGSMSACEVYIDGRRCVLSATKDISEIENVKEEAIRANEAKSEFLSSISHELRTPLNAILEFTQSILINHSEPKSEIQNNSVDLINSNVQHLLELVNQVLDWSLFETGKLDINSEDLNPVTIIDDCIEVSKIMAEPLSVSVIANFDPEAMPQIHCDALRLQQVLLNLLSNAVKYNRVEGTIELRVDQRNNYLRFTIIDSGVGIESSQFERVFEPFKRVNSQAQDDSSVGIGLAISRRLVEMMGGEIGFSSEIDTGSEFWFELPVSLTHKKVVEIQQDTEIKDLPNVLANNGHYKILCAEDNPINVILIKSLFENEDDIELTVTDCGEKALILAVAQKPDLILMDIGLSGMDGIETTLKLKQREDTKHIPVIALSAAALQDDLKRANEAGFLTYITKPIHIRPFLNSINIALGREG